MRELENIKCVMLDLDGTIYLGNSIFPFTLEFLNRLDRLNIRHLFLTNNSSLGTEAYLQKFAKMGIRASREDILISTHAAADYLERRYPGKRVFVLGTESMKRELLQKGICVTETSPEVVLCGFDTGLTYANLTACVNLVAKGLPYIATHPDFVCPAEEGFLPDLGSFMALIEACTGRRPEVICGKPNEQILIAAEHLTGFSRENLLMVGDRLMTDIAIGQWGVRTALVLSGESTREDVLQAPVKPSMIFENIHELGRELEKSF